MSDEISKKTINNNQSINKVETKNHRNFWLAIIVSLVILTFLITGIVAYQSYRNSSSSSSSSSNSQNYSNLWDYIDSRSDLTSFKKAVEKADLRNILKNNSSKLALFAPTNDAFNKLPNDLTNALLNNPEQKDTLVELIYNHIGISSSQSFSSQAVKVSDLANNLSSEITTTTGKVYFVSKNSDYYLNNAKIIEKDIKVADNMVNIVDQVVLPSFSLQTPIQNNVLVNYYREILNKLAGTYTGPITLISRLINFPNSLITLNSQGAVNIQASDLSLAILNNDKLKVDGVYPQVQIQGLGTINKITPWLNQNLLDIQLVSLTINFIVNNSVLPPEETPPLLQALRSSGLDIPTASQNSPLSIQTIATKTSKGLNLSNTPSGTVILEMDGTVL